MATKEPGEPGVNTSDRRPHPLAASPTSHKEDTVTTTDDQTPAGSCCEGAEISPGAHTQDCPFSPDPTEHAETVTAESLARTLCGIATERSAMHFGGKFRDNPAAEGHSAYALNAEWALAYVLREIPPALGDRLAKEIWACWEDGSQPHELPAEWLQEYGDDPEPLIAKHCGPAGIRPLREAVR